MLGFVFAARHPGLVKKLVMVGSGVYEERFAATIQPTRMARLTDDERQAIESLSESLNDATISDKSDLLINNQPLLPLELQRNGRDRWIRTTGLLLPKQAL